MEELGPTHRQSVTILCLNDSLITAPSMLSVASKIAPKTAGWSSQNPQLFQGKPVILVICILLANYCCNIRLKLLSWLGGILDGSGTGLILAIQEARAEGREGYISVALQREFKATLMRTEM